MKRRIVFVFAILLLGLGIGLWVNRLMTSSSSQTLLDQRLLEADHELLASVDPNPAELRASLGREWGRDPESAFRYSQSWLDKRPQDDLLKEMLILISVDVPSEWGLRILDEMFSSLNKTGPERLQELRYEMRTRLDPRGTLALITEQSELSPKLKLLKFEAGTRSEDLVSDLLKFAGTPGESALSLRILQVLLVESSFEKDSLAKARLLLESEKSDPELRSALYRLLEKRNDTSLTSDNVEKIFKSLPDNNKIQLIRAVALRCRKDRKDFLEKWAQGREEPQRSAARDVIKMLKESDPCH